MLRRRNFIRIISFFVAGCSVLAAVGIFFAEAKTQYEKTLEQVRLSNLASLCEYIRDMSSGLRILAVSADDALTDSSAFVCSRAMGAQGCLGVFGAEKAENINRFVACVYDFSENFSGTERKRKTALDFSNYAQELYYHLSDLSTAIIAGEYSLSELGSIYSKTKAPYFENRLDFSNGSEEELFSAFSSAAANSGEAEFLSDKAKISAEKAKEIAADLIKTDPALLRKGGEKEEAVETYSFFHGDSFVDISKAGGCLCRLIEPCETGEVQYSVSDALKKATEFSQKCGFESTVTVESEKSEFTAAFVLAPKTNGVLLLTAKLRIEISLVNLKVTYFDAFEYILNYRTDVFADNSAPKLSAVLPLNAEVSESCVCYAEIGGRERLCYMASCRLQNENLTVFADYYSGKILKIERPYFSKTQ